MAKEEIPLTNKYPDIRLLKSDVASEDFQRMAKDTIYGTLGHMRYAHVKSVEKIQVLKHTSFVEFSRKGKTIGIVALVGHKLNLGARKIRGLYVRYFSIDAPMRSNDSSKKSLEKKGLLHQMIKEQFAHPQRLVVEAVIGPSLFYAFVESLNTRSLNMVKSMGFEQSRALVTLLFSRFYPKNKLEVAELGAERFAEMDKLVTNLYCNYNLVPDFEDWDNYFIHEEGGEVMCGVKLETNTWRIYEMPGFDGWLFRKVLPRIPFVSRIFQGNKIDFIGIERLYIKPGCEVLLPDFLETLCARFGVTKALMGVDDQSPVHDLLKKHGRLGILDKLITPSPGLLFSRTYGISEEEKQSLQERPFYVSTYDMS